MKYNDFKKSPSGHLVPTVYGEQAFVPHPLPPKLDLEALAAPLAEAMIAIGELRGACRRLQNPYILIRPLQRLEAQTSSAMEGTYTTADELALAEAGLEGEKKYEAREVANYTSALAWAIKEMEQMPLSGRLFRGAHEILLKRVGQQRGQDKRPGEYKHDQNMIGGQRLENARFIPPPPDEAVEAMTALERYINRDDKNSALALIDLALVHYQFETIHPFADGNGRVGRMLISLMAISEGLLDEPVLYMSPELEEVKDDYIDLMYCVSSKGDWNKWIGFFLKILALSCKRTISTIDRVLALQTSYIARASEVSRSNNMVALINLLFENPVIRAKQVAERLSVTDAAARNLINTLVNEGILVQLHQYYPAVWFAAELSAVSRPRHDGLETAYR
jgi:Fic family protein